MDPNNTNADTNAAPASVPPPITAPPVLTPEQIAADQNQIAYSRGFADGQAKGLADGRLAGLKAALDADAEKNKVEQTAAAVDADLLATIKAAACVNHNLPD